MDLKYLATLKAILETGSFQKAALRLNYTRSTVTFQMQQLERELSVKLFEKIGRRMVLTQAGERILPYVDTVLESASRLESYGKDALEMTGSLRVAMPETLLVYEIQPVLKAFREQAPGVKLLIRSQNCSLTRSQILNGEVDVAVHYDIGGYNPTVVTERLKDFDQALIASPALEPEFRDFVARNQRKPLSLISNDRNCISQEIFDRYLKDRNIVIDNVIELWSVEAIKRSVVSNLGVAFVPRFAVTDELADGTLLELPTDLRDSHIAAIYAYHRNKWLSPAMELFLKLVKEHFTHT